MPEVHIDIDLAAYGRLARTLEKAEATVFRYTIRNTVKEAGAKMLAEAKANASWSRNIPAATSLRTSFAARSAGVTMRTDPKRVPYAYYFERGSKGSGGKYIKHPVFGSQREGARNDVRDRYDEKSTWRQMNTRKFFFKAGIDGRKEFAIKLQQELQAGLHSLGFH